MDPKVEVEVEDNLMEFGFELPIFPGINVFMGLSTDYESWVRRGAGQGCHLRFASHYIEHPL